MNLYPKAGFLEMKLLTCDRVETKYLPIDRLIPISRFDYWNAATNLKPFFRQNVCLDLEMIYADRQTKHIFVFDKEGTWHDEGVNHERLSLENTFVETIWYGGFNVTTLA